MKKYIKYLFYSLVAVTLFTAWSCSDDDKNKEQDIALHQLPQIAQAAIGQHFAGDDVLRIVTDIDDGQKTYEVYLASGTKIEFDATGNWIDIEAPAGASVPSSIIPDGINKYIADRYPGIGIHEISVVWEGYEVELNNGVELLFDGGGNIIGTEPDSLPAAAQAFLEQHFNGQQVARMTHTTENGHLTYEVYLQSGTKIEFDAQGNWTDVDMVYGENVPSSIIPAPILTYLTTNFPGVGVQEISVETYGYDVELYNGFDLSFDKSGNFLKIDK